MRISEFLTAIASWLENPNNEALLLAEYDDNCLKLTAEACLQAAYLIKKKAYEIEQIEPVNKSNIGSLDLDHLNKMLEAFDLSNNNDLKKTSNIIDELLLALAEKKDKNKQIIKDIDNSPIYQDIKINQAALSTRTCPDHHGTMVARIGEDTWQCPLDKKVYNFQTGFTMQNGEKNPGGSVADQTKENHNTYTMFDSRQERLSNK